VKIGTDSNMPCNLIVAIQVRNVAGTDMKIIKKGD